MTEVLRRTFFEISLVRCPTTSDFNVLTNSMSATTSRNKPGSVCDGTHVSLYLASPLPGACCAARSAKAEPFLLAPAGGPPFEQRFLGIHQRQFVSRADPLALVAFTKYAAAVLIGYRPATQVANAVLVFTRMLVPPPVDQFGVRPRQVFVRVEGDVLVFRLFGGTRLKPLGPVGIGICSNARSTPVIIEKASPATRAYSGIAIWLMRVGM